MQYTQRLGLILGLLTLVGCSALETRNRPAPVEERPALDAALRRPPPRVAPPAPQVQAPPPEAAVIVQPYVREAPIVPQPLQVEIVPSVQAAELPPETPRRIPDDTLPAEAVARDPTPALPKRSPPTLAAQSVERSPAATTRPDANRPAPAAEGSAVDSLLASAQREHSSGNFSQAAATLERALRIEPRNARLWHTLAKVRLAQGQPGLAAELARKSSTLAGNDTVLRQQNNALINEAQGRNRP